jgi:heptosyltransferase III
VETDPARVGRGRAVVKIPPPVRETTAVRLRLLYHAGALGDFVTILPAVSLWRRLAPDRPVAFLGRSEHGRFAREAGFVDDVWDIDRADLSRLFVEGGDYPPPAPIDEALLFTGQASPLVRNLQASRCGRITLQDPLPTIRLSKVDYHLSLFDDPPEVEALLAPLRRLARESPLPNGLSEVELGRTIVVHPGSGGRRKIWPIEGFRRTTDRLRELGWPILWCLGPAESERRLSVEGPRVSDLPLPQLASILGKAALYLGNDSGVSHLAAAAGCPTVALFGPSDEVVWTPRGAPVRVVVPPTGDFPTARATLPHRPIDAIRVPAVVEAAIDLLRSPAPDVGRLGTWAPKGATH